MSSHETSTAELRSLIARDLAASNELADRISQLRTDIAEGKPLPDKKVDLMERSNKDMTKDIVSRVEKIESSGPLDATDREMLQALNARLAVCDLQAMRLAELRDVEFMARSTRQEKADLRPDAKPDSKSDKAAAEHGAKPGSKVDEDYSEQDAGEHAVVDDDEAERTSEYASDSGSASETGSEYPDEPEIDKGDWPLLYQIMDVDPDTLDSDIEPMLNKAYKRLALKHSPQYLPNNSDAPAQWEKITKAYETLINPDKRQYYDTHGNAPSGLEDFDLTTLGETLERTHIAKH